MNKTIVNFISGIGKRIDGPTFIKDYEDSGTLISELQAIADTIKDAAIQDDLDLDIRYIKAGDQGEKNVYYELKNSFIPMLILHNVVIQYDDYKGQMDFILITHKFICILETKKLNGNITINSDGDFIRSFTNKHGKVYKKEGMYSPISQNQRHVRILENLLVQEKIIKKTPIISLVVIANPKSMIEFKYVKNDIRNQIVKYDQLTPRLKKMLETKGEVNLTPGVMTKMADYMSERHVEVESAFIQKYKKHVHPEEAHIIPTQYKIPAEAPVLRVAEQDAAAIDKKTTDKIPAYNSEINKEKIREALIKFRLEQSRRENKKAYLIFNNNQLDILLEKMPATSDELMQCDGFGAAKVDRYGKHIMNIING